MRTNLLGVSIDRVGRWEALRAIERRIAEQKQTAVFTPNPMIISRALRDRNYFDILNRGDLNLADGVGISVGARLAKIPPFPRVSGIDLAEDLLAYADRASLRVFLLGGRPQIAERAAELLRRRFLHLHICGARHGFFEERETASICRQIRDSHADILFVCTGSPRQEAWIDANRSALPEVKILMGLGGSLDVWAGAVTRAPHLLSTVGLEWLWRMILEPRRLFGIPDILLFLLAAAREGCDNKQYRQTQ